MGLILDVAVAALALAVVASLALLAWTLAVSAVQGVLAGRDRIAVLREATVEAHAAVRDAAAQYRQQRQGAARDR